MIINEIIVEKHDVRVLFLDQFGLALPDGLHDVHGQRIVVAIRNFCRRTAFPEVV